MPETYFIDTMGCQMNERDSETIAGVLESLGYAPAAGMDEARVIVLNTCAVREKPEHKVFSRLGDIRKLKQRRPETIVIVAGCVAQVAQEDIRARAPFVDVIIGPRNLGALADAVRGRQPTPHILADAGEVIPEGLGVSRAPGVSAFVNVTYGCDNFCAYCIVPHARGREQSRAPEAVVEETREAVAGGCVEITLLGQNVNSYAALDARGARVDFCALLSLVDAVPGLARVRFTTSHPRDLSPTLLEGMRKLPTVCEHLHLPIQSGDDAVLARMGRGYDYAHYRALVEAARERIPGLALTTDVMVGFPGETEAQFANTLRAFEELRFDQAFMFKYSDRPGTRAALFPDKTPEEVKQRRLEELIALQNEVGRQVNRPLVGKDLAVLVERPDTKAPHRLRGRTRANKLVVFDPNDPPPPAGSLVMVRAQEAFLWGFTGREV